MARDKVARATRQRSLTLYGHGLTLQDVEQKKENFPPILPLLFKKPFWAAALEGPMPYRTGGKFPYVRTYIRPPPPKSLVEGSWF